MLRGVIVTSVGSFQVSTEREPVCESLIHAMSAIYEEQSAEAVGRCIKRIQICLVMYSYIISKLWPSIAQYVKIVIHLALDCSLMVLGKSNNWSDSSAFVLPPLYWFSSF